ncbi:hypothetical protein JTS93_19875 [Clostridium botulinum]|nr:hypothetical protein [Clostridium botulinum]
MYIFKNGNAFKELDNIKFCLNKGKIENNGTRVVKEDNWIYYSGNEKFILIWIIILMEK